jgi:hypothetical protein
MSASTVAHEGRGAELETLALLAGYTANFALPWRLRPDVVRVCARERALFVGDAKETEAPAM